MIKPCLILFFSFVFTFSVNGNAQIITTIAGNETGGYTGDGFAAKSAEVHNPWGIKSDNAGNVYFADESNSRIRKINASGIITTFAGGGPSLGDGGAATAAQLSSPIGIVFDAA